ncbi:MAG: DinB family protein [Chloroflexi bacterium]|nr:MAG: DinB family protein [Chloroflexota bacterium]
MAHPYDAENEHSAAELRALVSRLSEAQLRAEVGGGWTVGTVLAHLAYWDRRVAGVCALWQRGLRTYPSPPDDAIDVAANDALEPLLRLVPPGDAARSSVEAAEAANAALAGLSPEHAQWAMAIDSPIVANRSGHRGEHIAQIEAALRG